MLPSASANCEVEAKQVQAPFNPRVERLLAKKAARKARKAQEAATTTKEEAEAAATNATAQTACTSDAIGSDATRVAAR